MNNKLFLGPVYVTMILALMLTFSGISFCQQLPKWMDAPAGIEMQKAFIAEQDKDGDGKVSKDEDPFPHYFDGADTNKDGFITLDEAPSELFGPKWMYAPQGIEMRKAFIAVEDKNGDGKVSKDEANEAREVPGFDAYDKNKDGYITVDEFPDNEIDVYRYLAGPVGKRGPHVEGGTSGADFIAQFDFDKNGEVSHGEWEAVKPTTPYREKSFPVYDMNRDYILTLDEAPLKEGESEAAPVDKKYSININQMAFIVKFDLNKDGKVDKTEFTGIHFPVFDRNGDGFIEPNEAPEGETAY